MYCKIYILIIKRNTKHKWKSKDNNWNKKDTRKFKMELIKLKIWICMILKRGNMIILSKKLIKLLETQE
jgi:hypothetical protein